MEFREESIEVFNRYCDTTLTDNMSFQEAVDNIESANNNYFYVSLCKDDVVNAINDEPELTNQLDLDKVYIVELGIFIALMP